MKRTIFAYIAISTLFVLPALGQRVRLDRGTPTPTPEPNPTPTPVVTQTPTTPPTQPPTPAPTPPPVVNANPTSLGMSSAPSSPTLNSVMGDLNRQIGLYNSGPSTDLRDAVLTGAQLTVVPPQSTTPSQPQTETSGRVRLDRGTPTPTGPTSISLNVTGWDYVVLQWGDINYHYYVGNSTGVQTFQGSTGLTSYTYFKSAPLVSVAEPGHSSALLIVGLASLGYCYRRFRARR